MSNPTASLERSLFHSILAYIKKLEAVVKAAREVLEANGREVVGRDGRVKLTTKNIEAEHKLVKALAALGDGAGRRV